MDDHYNGLFEYDRHAAVCLAHIATPLLLLTRREALPRFHPLQQIGVPVADGAAYPDVRRAVPSHAGLGQPGEADFHTGGRLLRGEEDEVHRGRPLRDRGGGESRLRAHFNSPCWLCCALRRNGLSSANW